VAVFNHSCGCRAEPTCVCAMQHMWTGGSWDGYELTRVRYYVDGEVHASVELALGMSTGQVQSFAQHPCFSITPSPPLN
jgi:hypothetical protein